jgi:mono/diheme cytochrome c family protein
MPFLSIARRSPVVAVAAAALVLAACEPGPPQDSGYPKVTHRTQQPLPRAAAPDPPPVTAGAAGAAAAGPVVAAELPAGVTQEMVNEGQEIYAASVCVACHGVAGSGSVIAPALNDTDWLHGDGSFESLVQVIRVGVPQPRQYPAPMPPMGGASFTEDQLRALGAYVYAISRAGGA